MYILIVLALVGLISIANLIVNLLKKCPDYGGELEMIRQTSHRLSQQHDTTLREELKNNRDDISLSANGLQQSLTQGLQVISQQQGQSLDKFQKQMTDTAQMNHMRLESLQESIVKSLHRVKEEVSRQLESIQRDNNTQLEKMRHTVDEKLSKTLEQRLGRSFELVGRQLEAVQKGLGEMQSLAAGVGDLKKVLTNVKTRGVMGEIQLGNILEQILTPDQYGLNVATIPGSGCHVEFALKLPGKEKGNEVWLPIDSKFPMDRYEQLVDAYESGEADQIQAAVKQLLNTVKSMAKDISQKYIAPPHTTDFGILFLPIESLYAEVVRHPGLMEQLQREYKIVLAGPSNLAAFLNSIQMGFRSLAIQQRSSEVWKILGAVKTEFGKFGSVLDKVQTKLQQASKTIDDVGVRSRAIERNLRAVEALPVHEDHSILSDGLEMNELSTLA